MATSEDAYLDAIAGAGVEAFVRNGRGLEMRLVDVDGRRVPLLISDGKPGNAAIFSPRGHYLEYPVHEIARSSRFWTPRSLRAALFPLAALLRLGNIDKVLYVNHWLLVGGPALGLNRQRIALLLQTLARSHPRHAWIFSGVVPALDGGLVDDLMALGGRAVQSRVVHLLDPRQSLSGRPWKKVRGTRNADATLARANETRRVDDPAVLLGQVERMRNLYEQLYLDKYARELNPQYRTAFFELLLQSNLFHAMGWLRDGVLDAFNIHMARDGVLCWSVCGYDCTAPVSRGLFRLAAGEDVVAGRRNGLVVNWGAGNADFKRYRGARPAFEYDIVFDRHLTPDRRLPWSVLQQIRARKSRAPRVPSGGTGSPRSEGASVAPLPVHR
jgi:hypothetical protein